MKSWQLQQAKARLSEVIQTAHTNGPQTITQRGIETAVVISIEEWKRVQAHAKSSENPTLLEVLQAGPQFDLNIPPRGRLKHREPAIW